MSSKRPYFVDDYFMLMDKNPEHFCKDQFALRELIIRIFSEENLIVEEERARKYFSLAKYLPFENTFEWERFVLGLHLCTYDERGFPRWPDLFCMLGRGAGKDGAIELEALSLISPYNPIREYDVDICANNKDQATRPVNDLVHMLDNNEKKMKKFFHWTKEIVTGRKQNSVCKGHTNNAKGKDGLRSGVVIFNEYHQYENVANVNVFTTGLGKKPEPRRSIFTTNGDVVDGPLDDMLRDCHEILFDGRPDNGLLPFICRLDDKEEVHDPVNWHKANPSLIYFPNLEYEIRKEYNEWKENPARLPAFMTKRMNVRDVTSEFPVTSWENIAATRKELPDMEGWECIAGIDFSKTTDWTAVNLHFKYGDQRYDINHAWICLQSGKIGRLRCPYKDWAERGLVTLIDEPEINPQYMIDYLLKMSEKYLIKEIAIDAYRYTIMRDYLDRAGFLYADKRIKFVRPSNIMRVYPLIDRCFANRWFHWDDNPVLRWSCNNTKLVRARKSTVTESGDNDIGNFLFGKIEPETRKTDPFMALVASMCFEEDLTDMKIIQEREFIPVFTF